MSSMKVTKNLAPFADRTRKEPTTSVCIIFKTSAHGGLPFGNGRAVIFPRKQMSHRFKSSASFVVDNC